MHSLIVSPALPINMEIVQHNRVIHKVRKTQHENPEFGHTRVRSFLKPAKKSTLALRGGVKLRKPSILVGN
jgi:hypothetical protein